MKEALVFQRVEVTVKMYFQGCNRWRSGEISAQSQELQRSNKERPNTPHLGCRFSPRHRDLQGETSARAGASDAHVTVAANLLALLRNHVRRSGCRVYMSDMKVRIES